MLWKTLLGSVSTYTDKLSTKICLWPSATMNCIDCSVWQHQNGQGLSVPLGASPSWLESTAAIRKTTPDVCAPPYQGSVAPGQDRVVGVESSRESLHILATVAAVKSSCYSATQRSRTIHTTQTWSYNLVAYRQEWLTYTLSFGCNPLNKGIRTVYPVNNLC